MKREEISQALGDIDPEFIEEAADGLPAHQSSPSRWWRAALPLAACLMLVLTAVWFGMPDRMEPPGAPVSSPGRDGVTAMPPPGMVGGTPPKLPEMTELTGRVTALDRDSRTLTLEGADGRVLTACIPDHLELADLEPGDNITLGWTGSAEHGSLSAEQILSLTPEE